MISLADYGSCLIRENQRNRLFLLLGARASLVHFKAFLAGGRLGGKLDAILRFDLLDQFAALGVGHLGVNVADEFHSFVL